MKKLAFILPALACGAAFSCGYSVVQSGPPFGLRRVAVVPFAEQEAVGLAPDLAQELTTQLAASGVEPTFSRQRAEAVLTGEIVTAATVPSPVTAPGNPIQSYTLRVLINATLTVEGKQKWRTSFWVEDAYRPSSASGTVMDTLTTEANRREAIRRVATQAALQIQSELTLADLAQSESKTPPKAPASGAAAPAAAGRPRAAAVSAEPTPAAAPADASAPASTNPAAAPAGASAPASITPAATPARGAEPGGAIAPTPRVDSAGAESAPTATE